MASIGDQYTYSTHQYLKDADAMHALFSDIPVAVTNTVKIAMLCNVNIELGAVHLPDFSGQNPPRLRLISQNNVIQI